jgi:hypothetical protein
MSTPVANQTWAASKTCIFHDTHQQLKVQQQTVRQAGFHAAYWMNADDQQKAYKDTAGMLTCLGTTTVTDCKEFSMLTNTVALLSQQLKDQTALFETLKKDSPPCNHNNNNGDNC